MSEPKFHHREVAALLRERDSRIAELEAVLQAAVDCGMVPTSSAREGGANAHSQQCKVADMIRDALEGNTDE